MKKDLLEFKNISHTYRSEKQGSVRALQNVEFSLSEGDFCCLIGPSGSGKSTLLNMAAGFIKPEEGTIIFRGKEVSSPSTERAVVFQEESLFPWMTVRRNLILALNQKEITGHEADKKVHMLLDLVGLMGFDHAYPKELSMGMRQKVSIARGLALSEDILLMDEPFSALDERSRMRLNRELLDLWRIKGITVLFITHSIDEAIRLGTKIVLLTTRPGRVEKIWTVSDLQKDEGSPENRELRKIIGSSMEMCCPKCGK